VPGCADYKSFLFHGHNIWLETGSQEVTGSIPASSTNEIKKSDKTNSSGARSIPL
jgi:hypothetical protein